MLKNKLNGAIKYYWILKAIKNKLNRTLKAGPRITEGAGEIPLTLYILAHLDINVVYFTWDMNE